MAVYAHLAHIALSRYTSQAFDIAGDPTAFPATGKPWQPQRLYYCALPMKWIARVQERMEALNLDPSDIEKVSTQIRENSEEVTVQISHQNDVTAYVQAKVESLACHCTQLSPPGPFFNLLKSEMAALMAQEYFIQARPKEIQPDFF